MAWDNFKSWIFFILWVLLGLAVLFWGVYVGASNYAFRKHAVVLQGVVSEIRSSSSDGIPVSSPTVKYFLPDGREMEYASRFASSLSSFSTGDPVEILWDPATGKVRLNAFGDLYFPAVFILLTGLFILFGPVFCIAVWLWIWGWPTKDNLAKMREAARLKR
ncbi:MAG TPA: DUF3592 domain-containing protein [Smithella sp.]|nr:DUF3592 domain-containing protein [Smithella sp.]